MNRLTNKILSLKPNHSEVKSYSKLINDSESLISLLKRSNRWLSGLDENSFDINVILENSKS
jgi:tetrahydromethanopterin S-methyltransferase subunit F